MNNPLLFILAACGVFAITAQATDYYVSAAGNDANPGTTTNLSWLTLGQVSSAPIQPGDHIHLKGSDIFPGPLSIKWSGASNSPISIDSYGAGRATIQAFADTNSVNIGNYSYLTFSNLAILGPGIGNSTAAGFDTFMSRRQYRLSLIGVTVSGFKYGIRIGAWASGTGLDGLLVDGCTVFSNQNTGLFTYGASVRDHTHFVIRRSLFYANVGDGSATNSNTGSGILVNGITTCLIEKCVAHDNGNPGGGAYGIWGYGVTGLTIQWCESYNNRAPILSDGGGFDLDGGVADSVIQYCYSHDNDGAGYLAWQYAGATTDYQAHSNNVIRYCVSKNDGMRRGYGALTFGGAGGELVTSLSAYNNTLYCATPTTDSGQPSCVAVNGQNCLGIKLWNNVFVAGNNRRLVQTWAGTTPAQALFQNNVYHSMPGTAFSIRWNGTNYTSLPAWRSAAGQEKNGAAFLGIQADPLLSAPGTAGIGGSNLADCAVLDLKLASLTNFTPAGISPCMNAGLDLAALYGIDPGANDIAGNPIPQGGFYDLGAVDFLQKPAVMSISPAIGTITGGTTVTLTGTNLAGVTSVTFGGTPATGISNVSPVAFTCMTPAHAAGVVDLGLSAAGAFTLSNAFTFSSNLILQVASAYGNPSPGVGVQAYAVNTPVRCFVTGFPVVNGATQYNAVGWTGTGSVTGGTGTNVTFNITNDTTLTWCWQTNVWVNLKTGGN